ncbi:MAG TPA: motility protein MotB, partial [Betaproteobacteria bacterium]|nr:motility protein MotB [Betaproteobacteria bacterium]
MSDDSQRPIIIKRVKKGGHGAHGGAWKIAYADFVTAMMAFFLLMWLLSSSSKATLQGIAEYFKTPLKVAMQGGEGSGTSSSVIKGGGPVLNKTVGEMRRSTVPVE